MPRRSALELHHDPTKGGPIERARFCEQYARTLAAYEQFFGAPPESFWPATHRRFGARPRFRVQDTYRSFWPAWPITRLWRGGIGR